VLDLKQIRQNFDDIQAALGRRGDYDLAPLRDLDQQQRTLETERSQLQARSNEIGKAVGQKIRNGADPKGEEVLTLREEGNQVKAQLAELDPQEKDIKGQIETILLGLPNLPSATTPDGKDETENVEIRRWGDEYRPKGETLKPHWEIGEALGLMNFERSSKIAQSRFVTLLGQGAALERALFTFMLDRHTSHGYTEVMPPYLVNTASLTASGQLPKFKDESFQCKDDDLWLSPDGRGAGDEPAPGRDSAG
jgi:seryl-tRNA synthetase